MNKPVLKAGLPGLVAIVLLGALGTSLTLPFVGRVVVLGALLILGGKGTGWAAFVAGLWLILLGAVAILSAVGVAHATPTSLLGVGAVLVLALTMIGSGAMVIRLRRRAGSADSSADRSASTEQGV